MFGKKEENNNAFAMQSMNTIGMGTSIEGNIMAEGDMRIDGKIRGNVSTSGRLVIGQTGEVTGDIRCHHGNIDGVVKGNVYVQEVLKITKSANIDGTLRSLKLIVEEGAVIEAKITMQ